MAMVAVGGSIGTGLLLGSGAAIKIAGPAVILSFAFSAFIAWTVTRAVRELATLHPAAGSFGLYAQIYLNSWSSFVSRYGFWIALSIAIGSELIASATYMSYWFPQAQPIFWVLVFAALLLLVNLLSVGRYGRFEYGFAMVKVVIIFLFVMIGGTLLLSQHIVPQYTSNGGFFPNGIFAPARAMSFALFTFGGIELLAVSSGESRSVAEISPAARTALALLAFLYLGAIVVLVGVMPWNGAGVAESPFVSVFRAAKFPAVSHIMNFVVLSAALSGANASLYADSRILFSLARDGYAPSVFGKLTASGSPLPALMLSSFGISLALIMGKWAPSSAYVFLLGSALFGLLFCWLVILAAHIVLRRQKSRGAARSISYRLGTWLSALGGLAILFSLVATWWASRVIVVSGIIYLVLLTLFYWVMKKARPITMGSETSRREPGGVN
jgi:L-asparagine transporter-like permease